MNNLTKITHAWEIPRMYLAGGIFGLSDEDAKVWRATAKSILDKRKIIVMDPMDNDHRGEEDRNPTSIVAHDLKLIRHCDAMIANLRTAGCGTAMELVYAKLWGMPVVGFNDSDRLVSPWLVAHCQRVVDTVHGACELACQWVLVK